MSILTGTDKNLDQAEFDKRFKWNFNKDGDLNHAGYGPKKPYVPPLQNPTTIYGLQERHDLLIESGTIWALSSPFLFFGQPFLIFWNGMGNGDTQDRFWYNNAMCEGA